MELHFDKYSYQARLLPALIAFAPLCFAAVVWSGPEADVWRLFVAIFVSLGFATLSSQLGRDLGKHKEASLFLRWNGKPTARHLSHRTSSLGIPTLNRYHAKLRELLPDLNIPDAADEMRNPNDALEIYESCTSFLREQTRDHKTYPLVFAENINYGFRRNLWAWKPFGIICSLVGITSDAIFLTLHYGGNRRELIFGLVSCAASTALLSLWVFVIKPSWVRTAAEAYAERLIASLDNL